MSGFNDKSSWGKEMNAPEHLRTYDQFLAITKWGIIICAGIVAFLILVVFS